MPRRVARSALVIEADAVVDVQAEGGRLREVLPAQADYLHDLVERAIVLAFRDVREYRGDAESHGNLLDLGPG
jgi:hypothetical protein